MDWPTLYRKLCQLGFPERVVHFIEDYYCHNFVATSASGSSTRPLYLSRGLLWSDMMVLVKILERWCLDFQMVISVEKSKEVMAARHHLWRILNVLNDCYEEVELVREFLYLGVLQRCLVLWPLLTATPALNLPRLSSLNRIFSDFATLSRTG